MNCRFMWSESCSVVSDSLWPHGLYSSWNFQVRILEWVAFSFSRGSSQHRDWIQVSCIAGEFFTTWATGKPKTSWFISLFNSVIGFKVFFHWFYLNILLLYFWQIFPHSLLLIMVMLSRVCNFCFYAMKSLPLLSVLEYLYFF